MKLLMRSTLLSLAIAVPAFAAERTVTLEVPDMNCAACPITIKKALNEVDGVTDVAVSFEPKEAVVRFDDERTSIEALQEATAAIGYPSRPKE